MKPTYQLTAADAVEVWKRRLGGEYQHRIAAYFDVNPGRISEVLTGKRFPGAEQQARQS